MGAMTVAVVSVLVSVSEEFVVQAESTQDKMTVAAVVLTLFAFPPQ